MNAENLIQSALHHHQAGQLRRAAALYKEALAIEPNNANALHFLGVIAHQYGENERAVTLIKRSTQLDDRNADAFNNLGEAQRGLDELSGALHSYKKAVDISPRHVAAHYNLGMTLVASDKATASLEVFEKALSLAPNDVDICIGFASALHSLQRFEQSIELYHRALHVAPQSAEVLLALGAVHADMKNAPAALMNWRKAATALYGQSDLLPEIVNRMLQYDYLDAAIDLHDSHFRDEPPHGDMLAAIGATLKRRRRNSQAADFFKRAITAQPAEANHWLELSACLIELMRLEEAKAALDQALLHGRENAYTLVLRSQILLLQFHWEAAEDKALEAMSLEPDAAMTQAQLACVRFHRGDIKSAADLYFRHVVDTRSPGAPAADRDERFKTLTRTKLLSDVEQLTHLKSRDLLPKSYEKVLTQAKTLLKELPDTDTDNAYRFDTPPIEPFAAHFNRSLYQYRPGPLEGSVLSSQLDVEAVLSNYRCTKPAAVRIDRLLSDEALLGLQRFCNESSIWFQSRFRYEVGATLRDGFSCPLLLQIAHELRSRFAAILDQHLFKECWAYKYYQSERAGHIHADDNAISINVWITPDEANENPDSGGLTLWNKTVPGVYFDQPSERTAITNALTAASDAIPRTVPYACNRAILFNGNVLHNSDYMHFKNDYLNRRISITYAFGEPER